MLSYCCCWTTTRITVWFGIYAFLLYALVKGYLCRCIFSIFITPINIWVLRASFSLYMFRLFQIVSPSFYPQSKWYFSFSVSKYHSKKCFILFDMLQVEFMCLYGRIMPSMPLCMIAQGISGLTVISSSFYFIKIRAQYTGQLTQSLLSKVGPESYQTS